MHDRRPEDTFRIQKHISPAIPVDSPFNPQRKEECIVGFIIQHRIENGPAVVQEGMHKAVMKGMVGQPVPTPDSRLNKAAFHGDRTKLGRNLITAQQRHQQQAFIPADAMAVRQDFGRPALVSIKSESNLVPDKIKGVNGNGYWIVQVGFQSGGSRLNLRMVMIAKKSWLKMAFHDRVILSSGLGR
jgi:hypothetical protein